MNYQHFRYVIRSLHFVSELIKIQILYNECSKCKPVVYWKFPVYHSLLSCELNLIIVVLGKVIAL